MPFVAIGHLGWLWQAGQRGKPKINRRPINSYVSREHLGYLTIFRNAPMGRGPEMYGYTLFLHVVTRTTTLGKFSIAAYDMV